jgi:hypothetical protein
VLKEVSESRLPRFDLVPGARADNQVIGNNIGIIEGNGYDFESVFQLFDFVLIRKNIGTVKSQRKANEDKKT